MTMAYKTTSRGSRSWLGRLREASRAEKRNGARGERKDGGEAARKPLGDSADLLMMGTVKTLSPPPEARTGDLMDALVQEHLERAAEAPAESGGTKSPDVLKRELEALLQDEETSTVPAEGAAKYGEKDMEGLLQAELEVLLADDGSDDKRPGAGGHHRACARRNHGDRGDRTKIGGGGRRVGGRSCQDWWRGTNATEGTEAMTGPAMVLTPAEASGGMTMGGEGTEPDAGGMIMASEDAAAGSEPGPAVVKEKAGAAEEMGASGDIAHDDRGGRGEAGDVGADEAHGRGPGVDGGTDGGLAIRVDGKIRRRT